MATSYTPAAIHQAMDTDRWNASQAGREQPELDVLSVYLVVKAKVEAGLVDEARAIIAKYRSQKS